MGRLPTALSPSVAAAGNQTKQVSRRSQFVVPFLPDHSSSPCRPTLPLVGMPVAIWAASRLTVNIRRGTPDPGPHWADLPHRRTQGPRRSRRRRNPGPATYQPGQPNRPGLTFAARALPASAVDRPADRRPSAHHGRPGPANPARPQHSRPRRRAADTGIDPRLTALYRDPDVTALLRRYRIPRRHQPGTITGRFPTAHRPTAAFLRAAYTDTGLAAAHTEQLTGYPADQILDDLHRHGFAVRPASSFSPWYLRTYRPDRPTERR